MAAHEEQPSGEWDKVGNEEFKGVGELRGEGDGAVLEHVVLLVDILVDGGVVQGAVPPVEQGVLHQKGDAHLQEDGGEGGKRSTAGKGEAEVGGSLVHEVGAGDGNEDLVHEQLCDCLQQQQVPLGAAL